ncbi:hypothetical protein STENM223S_07820 [Streptomyces tendae]
MHVVDGHQDRALVRVGAQQPPQPGRTAPVVAARRHVRELRYRAEEVEDHGEGHRGVLGRAAHAQHPQAAVLGVPGGGLQHGGASGAAGSAQQDEAAGAGPCALDLGGQQRVGVVAFTERSGHRCLLWWMGFPRWVRRAIAVNGGAKWRGSR